MNNSEYKAVIIPTVHKDFSQLLSFKYIIEEVTESGRKSFISIEKEVEIIYLGEQNQFDLYQVFLYQTEIKFERKPVPDRELLIKLTYVFDELVVSTDFAGTIWKVNNLPFLKYRWKKKRAELVDEYFTEEYARYFTTIDEILFDNDSLVKYLKTPAIYGAYFNGLRVPYKGAVKIPVIYGDELEKLTLEDEITVELNQINSNVVHKLNLASSRENVDIKVSGECIYVNGVLDCYKKEVNLGSKKIIYIAKWLGLKTFYK